MTRAFNHTRVSLLIVILLHASIDMFSLCVGQFFLTQAESQVNILMGFGLTALVPVVLTRGHLGYAADQQDQHQKVGER
jgi:hypothetical protein